MRTKAKYVCKVRVSGSMSLHYVKAQPEFLRKKGYEIAMPEREEYVLIHSDKNIKLITDEIKNRFPSSKISKIEIMNWKIMHIRDVEFNIHDYSDI
jgi:hypothetical protein